MASRIDLRFTQTRSHRIAYLAYEPKRARGIGLVVGHGYSSSKQNLDLLCNFLASHGFATFSLDFPGHKLGTSLGTLRSLDDLVDSMQAVVECAREALGAHTPIYTIGHSMGATTAILTAASDDEIAGVVSIATGIGRIAALEALATRGATDLRSAYVDGLALPELAAQIEPRLVPALASLTGRPQLYVAAERDMMVARSSVESLFALAPEPKTLETVSSDHTYAGEASRSVILGWLNARHPRAVAAPV
ncbi:MAG TPA: alpha/beta fold hydrolase [Candidatus Acidoferrales bacterium]|nr:alpha/beta fold hydrolase [Candidatus Acidoferrales bacterium]